MKHTRLSKRLVTRCAFLGALLVSPGVSGGPTGPSHSGHVSAQLVAEVESIKAGEPFWVGLRLDIDKDWHVNWTNPGDAGLAPFVTWKLPDGFSAEELQWPSPRRFSAGPLTIFGYAEEVLLMSRITPPPELTGLDRVALSAVVDWLACSDACVPGSAEVELSMPVTERDPQASSKWRDAFAAARSQLPAVKTDWRFEARLTDEDIVIAVRPAAGAPGVSEMFFYPSEQGVIANAEEQQMHVEESYYSLRVRRDQMVRSAPERLQGVLVVSPGRDGTGGPWAVYIDIELTSR